MKNNFILELLTDKGRLQGIFVNNSVNNLGK